MLKLIAHSRKILTDSGGVPCITMRENNEWLDCREWMECASRSGLREYYGWNF